MRQRPFACPNCNAPLRFEVEGVIHYTIDPRDGSVGTRAMIYDDWTPMSTPRAYCLNCSTPFQIWYNGRTVVDITPYSEESP